MKKLLALTLTAAMLTSLLAGCGTQETSTLQSEPSTASVETTASADTPAPEPAVSAAEPQSAAEPVSVEEPVSEHPSLSYPLVTDGSETVTVWVSLPPHVSPYMEDVADSACYRQAQTATGIQMQSHTVSAAAESEQFQLMCASGSTGDFDVIVGATMAYGSADGAVEDGILRDLSEDLESDMPDFYGFLQSDEEIRKLLTTDNGAVVDIAGRATGGRPQGFGIRKDWLDKAGLDIPKTYDELYTALTAFKNDFGASQPLLMFSTGFLDNDFLCSGLGMTQSGYYIENDQVRFAYVEDSFKEYCQLIHKWYAEGLLSKDFLNNVQGAGVSYDAQMLDGTAGVFMTGADIFSSASAASAADADWEVVPMADVTRTGTETITLGRTPNGDPLSMRWNVTTGVTDDRLANVLGFINWFFTEDGSIACNFGIEGEGFEYDENGNPHLTELVTNNPEGYGAFVAEAIYLNWCAPYCLDERYYDSVYDTEAQANASGIWNSNRDNTQQYKGSLTSEENTEYSALYSDISTYISNMAVSFMTGAAEIDTLWDTFVSTIEGMDLDRCVELKQAAYDRYHNR